MLYEAALEDQGMFNSLPEDRALRDLLKLPGVRRLLQSSKLLEPEPPWRKLARWFETRTLWAAAGPLAAAAVILLVLYPGGRLDPEEFAVPLATGTVAELSIADVELFASAKAAAISRDVVRFNERLMLLPVAETVKARFALRGAGPRRGFRVGEEVRTGFMVEKNANVILQQGEGSRVQLLPNGFTPSHRVQAESIVLIPPNR